MAYNCKIFEVFNLTFHGHYTHVCEVSKDIGINTEIVIFLLNKECISGH